MKLIKKSWKLILIFIIALSVTSASLFAALSHNYNNNQQRYNSETGQLMNAAPAGPTTPATSTAIRSPKCLAVTYPLQYVTGSATTVQKVLIDGLRKMNKAEGKVFAVTDASKIGGAESLFSTDVSSKLLPSFTSLVSKDALGVSTGIVTPQPGPFQNADEVRKLNMDINGIEQNVAQSKTMAIYKPEQAYDVFAFGKNPTTPVKYNFPAAALNNFTYKVAEIDVNTVPDDKNLMFDFKFPGSTSVYTLVINNWKKQLTNDVNNIDVKALMASGDIYIRNNDDSAAGMNASNTVNQSWAAAKGITLKADAGKLSIFVKPSSTTEPVLFSINSTIDQSAKGAIKIGYKDYSLMAKYLTYDTHPDTMATVNTTKPMFDTTKVLQNFKVQRIQTEWEKRTNFDFNGGQDTANVLTFWIEDSEKMSGKLHFNEKASEAFEGSVNDFLIEISSGQFTLNPKSFKIIQSVFNNAKGGGVKPIRINTQLITQKVGGKIWYKIELGLQFGVLAIDPSSGGKENPYKVKIDQRIFFDKPYEDASVTPGPKAPKNIPVTAYVDNSKDNLLLIGTIYANWWDQYTASDNDFILRPNNNADVPKFGIQYQEYHELNGGALELNPVQNEQLTPNEAVIKLNDYTNKLRGWAISKLGVDPTDAKWEENFYQLTDINGVAGWIKKRFLDGSDAPNVDLLRRVATMAATVFNGKAADLTDVDKAFINEYARDHYHSSGKVLDSVSAKPTTGPASHTDKSKLLQYIEPFLVKLINDRFKIEKRKFDSLKSKLIASDMVRYLDKPSNGGIAINKDSLKEVTKVVRGGSMHLLAIHGSKTQSAANGLAQLKSLTEFIIDFKLQNKYLESADAISFNTMAGVTVDSAGVQTYDETKNLFLHKDIWKNVGSAPQQVRTMVKLLDNIFRNILNGRTDVLTIDKVIDKILVDPTFKADAELTKTFNGIINIITSDEQTMNYEYFGREFHSTYIQNLAVGRNLLTVIKRYIKINKAHLSAEGLANLQKINDKTAFDVKVITKIAVNNKYYNVPYFLNGLSVEGKLSETVNDLLDSRLEDSVSLELPETNALVDFLSDPTKLAGYGFTIIGALMTIVGGVMFLLSLRKSNSAGKVMTISFLAIAIFGIILLTAGIMIPALVGTGTGPLAALAG